MTHGKREFLAEVRRLNDEATTACYELARWRIDSDENPQSVPKALRDASEAIYMALEWRVRERANTLHRD